MDDQEVVAAVREFRLLALISSDSVVLCPAFQIHNGRVIAGLQEVLTALRSGTEGRWTRTQFLVAVPVEGNKKRRHIDALHSGDVATVQLSAEHNAWARRS